MFFRRLVLSNLAIAAFVEFVERLYTFPLAAELVLVPVVGILAACQAVAGMKLEYAPAKKLITGVLTLLGLTIITFTLLHLAKNVSDIATAEKLKEFFLPFVMTTCFVPFLYIVRLFATVQTILVMTRLGMQEHGALYRHARWAIIIAIGLSLERAELFDDKYRGSLGS